MFVCVGHQHDHLPIRTEIFPENPEIIPSTICNFAPENSIASPDLRKQDNTSLIVLAHLEVGFQGLYNKEIQNKIVSFLFILPSNVVF